MVFKFKKRVLTRAAALDFLEKLTAIPQDTDFTLYLPPHPQLSELEKITVPPDISAKILEIIKTSNSGATILRSATQILLVVPPFPVAEKSAAQSLDTAPLKSLLNRKLNIGIVLVRLGSYAVGFCRGDNLVSSKVGTGLVHGRHRQGGSSAHRFERHRDKQIESFLTRVCGHVRQHLEPHLKTMDYILYGGARTTILTLQKQCPLLGKLDAPALPPLYDIPDPRQPVLESAISHVWSSSIYSWEEN